MGQECVLDTTVLQKANAPLLHEPGKHSLFRRRIRLLEQINRGKLGILISKQLLDEYKRQVKEPRNDYVRAFFELLVSAGDSRCVWNYAAWTGQRREHARHCRFPKEDDHVLQTAIRSQPTTIFSEENRMLRADACIYRRLRVRIRAPE